MKNRSANHSNLIGVGTLVALLVAGLPHLASAAAISLAYVNVYNCGEVVNQGPISASASNTGIIGTGVCATPGGLASGGASFTNGLINLDMTSITGRGVTGQAYLDDYLTFHISGGGSAVVSVSMAGDWGGHFNDATNASFQVEFDLGLGPAFYAGKGYSNLAYDDGLVTSDAFTGTNPSPGQVLGSYLFTTNWTIQNNVQYEFFAGLKADASNGATAYITDPLIITLPAGVTYTSLSGRTYAATAPPPTVVPEPTTLLLLASGLGAGRFIRRRKSR